MESNPARTAGDDWLSVKKKTDTTAVQRKLREDERQAKRDEQGALRKPTARRE